MNVRSFPPDKFRQSYEDEIKQRATWFYCPQSLSEYKIPTLDLAHRQKILVQLQPKGNLDNPYIAPLLQVRSHHRSAFTEQAAFRHYLHCLHLQADSSVRPSFDDTVAAHIDLLDDAEALLKNLSTAGILGQQRDFETLLILTEGPLRPLLHASPILRHRWTRFSAPSTKDDNGSGFDPLPRRQQQYESIEGVV